MKVLTVQFDVTNLSEEDIADLQFALEAQGENACRETMEDAPLLNSGVREIDEEEYKETH